MVRLQSDERLHGRKLKWADVELLDPSEGEVVDLHLTTFTTALAEREAANAIISFLEDCGL